MRSDSLGLTHCNSLVFTTLQDLNHAVFLLVGAELILQNRLGSTVHDTLGTVTISNVRTFVPVKWKGV